MSLGYDQHLKARLDTITNVQSQKQIHLTQYTETAKY